MTDIRDSLELVRERIEKACLRSGRRVGEVTLIAVSKTVDASVIEEAARCGIRNFGENYVQEAKRKIDSIGNREIVWHMIGHLQTNKLKYIPGRFQFVHSIDRWELIEKLEKFAVPTKILFELNLSGETTKHGADERGLEHMLERTDSLSYVEPCGLMTMAPYVDNPEKVRSIFTRLRETLEKMNDRFSQSMRELSMGMSSDFEVAIEEGATMVRIGTALFGERA